VLRYFVIYHLAVKNLLCILLMVLLVFGYSMICYLYSGLIYGPAAVRCFGDSLMEVKAFLQILSKPKHFAFYFKFPI